MIYDADYTKLTMLRNNAFVCEQHGTKKVDAIKRRVDFFVHYIYVMYIQTQQSACPYI